MLAALESFGLLLLPVVVLLPLLGTVEGTCSSRCWLLLCFSRAMLFRPSLLLFMVTVEQPSSGSEASSDRRGSSPQALLGEVVSSSVVVVSPSVSVGRSE